MRMCALPLLAVVPLVTPYDVPPAAWTPCSIAIELEVRAPLRWGAIEWRLAIGEAARIWAPYGVTLCWNDDGDACRGIEVKLRVLLAPDPPPPPHTTKQSLLGWIWFRGEQPGADIVLSVNDARNLVGRARVGDRPLASWPASAIKAQLPRAVGRALAHEIGHFVLRDRTHAPAGLMTSRFTPNQVTGASSAAFRLPSASARWVRETCGPVGLRAGGAAQPPRDPLRAAP